MKMLLMTLFVVTLVAGCTTDEYFQKVTAPMTKCNTSNLQITDINRDKPTTWRAICRSDGRIYQCTKSECTELKQTSIRIIERGRVPGFSEKAQPR